MYQNTSFVFNHETSVVYSHFDDYGYENSIVLHQDKSFYVSKKPAEVMEDSFQHYGYHFGGAIKGAQSILERKKMVPFVLDLHKGIVLIQVNALDLDNKAMVYINYSKIRNLEDYNGRGTIVYLNNGYTIFVGTKYNKVKPQCAEAAQLYLKMLTNSQSDPDYSDLVEMDYDPKVLHPGIQFTKDKKEPKPKKPTSKR